MEPVVPSTIHSNIPHFRYPQAIKGDLIDKMMSELLSKIMGSDEGVIPSNFQVWTEVFSVLNGAKAL